MFNRQLGGGPGGGSRGRSLDRTWRPGGTGGLRREVAVGIHGVNHELEPQRLLFEIRHAQAALERGVVDPEGHRVEVHPRHRAREGHVPGKPSQDLRIGRDRRSHPELQHQIPGAELPDLQGAVEAWRGEDLLGTDAARDLEPQALGQETIEGYGALGEIDVGPCRDIQWRRPSGERAAGDHYLEREGLQRQHLCRPLEAGVQRQSGERPGRRRLSQGLERRGELRGL